MPSSMKDFKVVAQLGKGSYGSVVKVERLSDGLPYAVKEINIRRLSPREREDALNEIRILASIKQRHIVRYCDAFTERDNLYIVMEFAEGGDIGRQIEKYKKANKYVKEDTIWSYTIQICRALNEMHSRSILHRDLKPKNIFLTAKNHIRLGDLGCAKLMKTGLARTQIGTPYYMSPEIWLNKPYDNKSDMWALGCILYELCMLVPPFLANDMNGLALKVKTAPVPRISKHYSDDLANLVASLLSKDPRARPDVRTILSMPIVLSKMSLVPEDEDGPWAGEDMRTALLATIRVPHMFGMGGRPAGLNLPAPAYPMKRSDSASGDVMTADMPAAAAVAGYGAALPPRTAAPAAAPAPPVRSFASATSPPQLMRMPRPEMDVASMDAGRIAQPAFDRPLLSRAPSAAGLYPAPPRGLSAAPSAKQLVAAPPSAAAALPSARAAMAAPSAYAPSSAAAMPMKPAAPRAADAAVARPGVRRVVAPSSGAPSVPSSAMYMKAVSAAAAAGVPASKAAPMMAPAPSRAVLPAAAVMAPAARYAPAPLAAGGAMPSRVPSYYGGLRNY